MKEQDVGDREAFEPVGEQFTMVLHERGTSLGGVVLPEVTRRRIGEGQQVEREAHKATVVAVGAQCRYIRRGDVIYLQGQIRDATFEGVKLWFGLESQNVLGILSDKDGSKPRFRVTNWKDQIVQRHSDPRGSVGDWERGYGE